MNTKSMNGVKIPVFIQEYPEPGIEPSYVGYYNPDFSSTVLKPDKSVLDPSKSVSVYPHSNEFNWGYEGSGPAQLALAILIEELKDNELAFILHQEFKRDIIARFLQGEVWSLPIKVVKDWVKLHANLDLDGQVRIS